MQAASAAPGFHSVMAPQTTRGIAATSIEPPLALEPYTDPRIICGLRSESFIRVVSLLSIVFHIGMLIADLVVWNEVQNNDDKILGPCMWALGILVYSFGLYVSYVASRKTALVFMVLVIVDFLCAIALGVWRVAQYTRGSVDRNLEEPAIAWLILSFFFNGIGLFSSVWFYGLFLGPESPDAKQYGVGLGLARVDEGFMVKDTIVGGPAWASGQIKPGDVIVSVDGNNVQSLATISPLVFGPAGSQLTLGIWRYPRPLNQVSYVTLVRAPVAAVPEGMQIASTAQSVGLVPPGVNNLAGTEMVPAMDMRTSFNSPPPQFEGETRGLSRGYPHPDQGRMSPSMHQDDGISQYSSQLPRRASPPSSRYGDDRRQMNYSGYYPPSQGGGGEDEIAAAEREWEEQRHLAQSGAGHLGNREDPDVADALLQLGRIYSRHGRHAEAVSVMERALAARQQAYGPSDPRTAAVAARLGAMYRQAGRLDEAGKLLLAAMKALVLAHGTAHPEVGKAAWNLGRVYEDQGQLTDAESAYNDSVKVLAACLATMPVPAGDSKLRETYSKAVSSLFTICVKRGRLCETDAATRRAARTRAGGNESAAAMPDEMERLVEAEQLYLRALNTEGVSGVRIGFAEGAVPGWEGLNGVSEIDVGETLHALGNVFRKQGRLDEAESTLTRGLRVLGANNVLRDDIGDKEALGLAISDLALVHRKMGRYREAEAGFQRAMQLLQGVGSNEAATTAAALQSMRQSMSYAQ